MANTTNFGWETPDDTDLVKDGAAAMRTLGSAIDTSFVDLKGGTTGQNLRKATNTDLDFTWAGDATNTVIDAEGDLLVGDAADTLQRLAIGTTGQVLTVDTAVDGKIKWAAPATASLVGCQLEKSTSQAITTSTRTLITWDTETFDTDNFHSTSSNTSRITIPTGKAGYYRFDLVGATYNFTYWEFRILKNGVAQKTFVSNGMTNGTEVISTMFYVINLAAGDYVEWDVWQNAGSNRNVITYSLATATYLGA